MNVYWLNAKETGDGYTNKLDANQMKIRITKGQGIQHSERQVRGDGSLVGSRCRSGTGAEDGSGSGTDL